MVFIVKIPYDTFIKIKDETYEDYLLDDDELLLKSIIRGRSGHYGIEVLKISE